jgi:hypothetical protein
MRRLVLLAVVLTLAAPCVAFAQIYVKRDERGVLVLSDQPLGDGARTFEVPKSRGLRVTRAADPSAVARYADVIEQHASRLRVRPELVRAVIQVESGFNPFARSHKGAMGLMQLMPQTAADYGVVDAYNPAENIRAGVAYLRALLDHFHTLQVKHMHHMAAKLSFFTHRFHQRELHFRIEDLDWYSRKTSTGSDVDQSIWGCFTERHQAGERIQEVFDINFLWIANGCQVETCIPINQLPFIKG